MPNLTTNHAITYTNTVIEKNSSLESRMWRHTRGGVTCEKPSGQHNDPGVSHTFSRRFLKQNYPKYICDIVGVRKKNAITRSFV